MGQLRFEGAEFARTLTNTGMFIKGWEEEIRATLSQKPILLFADPPDPPAQLFEPAPTCDYYLELEDQYLTCHLDRGHEGLHYDGQYFVDWFQR